MALLTMHLNIAEIIFLILLGGFLFVLFVWLPFMILKESVQTLIGRPVGFGWKRANAEVRTAEVPKEIQEQAFAPVPPVSYAVFEEDGTEHRTPLPGYHGSSRFILYVRRDNPDNVWHPKYENRFAALIGALIILAFWAGLVYGGIVIARMIRG